MKCLLIIKPLNNLSFSVACLVSSAAIIFSVPIFAEMTVSANLKLSDYIGYMSASKKKRKLTGSEKDLLYLSQFAFDTVGLSRVSIAGSNSSSLDQLSKRLRRVDLVSAFERKVFAPEVWGIQLDKKEIQNIIRNKARLKILFHSSEYSWAWILKQLGKPRDSKTLLKALFNKEYQRVMALKEAVYGLGGTPLGNSEKILHALNTLVDGQKQGVFNEKMRKMKVHISKLPESHIVT